MTKEDFTIQGLQRAGFGEFHSVRCLKERGGCVCIPKTAGVYVVYRESTEGPNFLRVGTCGYERGEDTDPNVCIGELLANWVPGAHVLNSGKAGTSLRRRIREYMRAGSTLPHKHSGGRYIWQLADCDDLLIAWKPLTDEDPAEVESRLIAEFEAEYLKLPFANLRH